MVPVLHDDAVSPLFLAVIEATEEAILNSLSMASTMKGRNGVIVEAMPMERVMGMMREYKRTEK